MSQLLALRSSFGRGFNKGFMRFIIGLLAELFQGRLIVSPTVRAALMTGVLGGYTTFSSFSLLANKTTQQAPYCLGVTFKPGEIPAGSEVGSPQTNLQATIKNRWPCDVRSNDP